MNGAVFTAYEIVGSSDWAISTSQLQPSRVFHTWPINVMVYHGSQWDLVFRLVSRLDAFSGYLVHT